MAQAMQHRLVRVNGLQLSTWLVGDGPRLALLLHGFPDDPGSLVPLAERLAGRGFRCALPHLRGQGRSERPADRDYSLPALARDAVGLIDALEGERALLVGHDWGALIGYAAANLSPGLVSHLVALALPPPEAFLRAVRAHPRQLRRSWYMGLFQLPGLAERALRRRNYALIDRLWREWSPGWEPPPERLSEVKRTFDWPGTVDAALALYRNLVPRPGRLGAWREGLRLALPPLRVPTLVVAGQEDGCIGVETFQGLERCFAARHRLEVLLEHGHWLPLEAPDRLAELIDEHLAADEPPPSTRRGRRPLPVVA